CHVGPSALVPCAVHFFFDEPAATEPSPLSLHDALPISTRIPGAPPVVAGVVNVRGTLVTVVEGWRALRQPEPAADGGGRGSGTTVLLEVGGGKKLLGFTVDEVVDLVSVGGETLDRRQALP